jgi:solute carrier family 35, member C2
MANDIARKRASKLTKHVTFAQDTRADEAIPSSPPKNLIDPNISGLAHSSLQTNAPDLNDIQAELDAIEQTSPESSKKKFKRLLIIVLLSFVVVSSAIATTIFQSMLLSANHHYFPFPIFSAAVTNFVQLLAAGIVLGYFGGLGQLFREIWTRNGLKAIYQAILPCSIVTAAELSISLLSLQYVSVSFFTMVKSSSIIFILLGAFMTGQEQVNAFLLGVILLTGVGVIFAAWDPKSTAGLEVIGFSLVMLASVLNAAKWILTELLLNENLAFKAILKTLNSPTRKGISGGKVRNLTPLLSVLLLAPITLTALLIGSVVFEGFPMEISSFIAGESAAYVSITMGSLLLTSCLVFVMRVADFRLVQMVSLVTFSLLGIIKEIFMIMISVIFLGEVLFPVNVVGLVITIIGVALYNYYRILESRNLELRKRGDLEIELQLRQRSTERVKNQVFPVPVK